MTTCIVAVGCSNSTLPPIKIPENAKVFRENYYPFTSAAAVPPDSSGRYYVYDETDNEVTTAFFVAPETPVNLNCLPGGHRYRVYYIPREGGPATAPVREVRHGDTEAIRQRAREVAEKLTWLDLGFVIYVREYYRWGPADAAENRALLRQLLDMTYTMEDALPLLKDPDPKVRTLGIVMLYQSGGAPAVNEIASLMDDDAPTFPTLGAISAVAGRPVPKPYPMEKRKVKDWATTIVHMHLSAAGSGPWREYWAIRKDRPYGAADFVVALNRAKGSTPIRPERMAAIRQVGDEVRKLPMPDRFFILHKLWFQMGGRFPKTQETPIVTRDELIALARQLPVETRWAFAHDRRTTDDPDQVQYPSEGNYVDARRLVMSVE
ncbi:MAG: hypothetical protein ACHRHE_02300 [Tepidisphaerales bacterium]